MIPRYLYISVEVFFYTVSIRNWRKKYHMLPPGESVRTQVTPPPLINNNIRAGCFGLFFFFFFNSFHSRIDTEVTTRLHQILNFRTTLQESMMSASANQRAALRWWAGLGAGLRVARNSCLHRQFRCIPQLGTHVLIAFFPWLSHRWEGQCARLFHRHILSSQLPHQPQDPSHVSVTHDWASESALLLARFRFFL